MSNINRYNLKRTLQTIVSIVTDDDDEVLIDHENRLLKKYLLDVNDTNCTHIGVLSHIIVLNAKPQRRTEVEHDDSFCDEEVPKLSLETFQSLFGVSRRTVEILRARLGNEITCYPTKFRVPLRKRILMMLWILANQESFRSVGERFGMMAPGNVHYVFYSMCDSVCVLSNQELTWPSKAKQRLLAGQLTEKFCVSSSFGVLGCTYIAIKCPDKNEEFYEHNGVPSLCLQAVCDYKLSFLDVHAGNPGSYLPAEVFRLSPLCSKLDSIVDNGLSIIASEDYPSCSKLNIHGPTSSSLALISQAFTKLRNTFQRLKYIDMQRPHATVKLIQTACTLHNLVISEGETY